MNTGWICPRCGQSNAPAVLKCCKTPEPAKPRPPVKPDNPHPWVLPYTWLADVQAEQQPEDREIAEIVATLFGVEKK